MKRRLVVAIILVVAVAFWLLVRQRDSPEIQVRVQSTVNRSAKAMAPEMDGPAPSGPSMADLHDHIAIADNLNDPKGTIGQDFQILRDVFSTWLTNFPREGNPVGDNSEITAALSGKNRLGLVLIEPNHRAINARGELVDRWGTPFRLHQLSGTRMELQSAGPDRRFATADDVTATP